MKARSPVDSSAGRPASAEESPMPFADEPAAVAIATPEAWKILVVDDDEEVRGVTRMVLRDLVFEGRGLHIMGAGSGREALSLLDENPDTAVLIIDVVMETELAGLDVVRRLREAPGNHALRIILRTGQAGLAPESRIILDYDINDYKEKTELTAQKLRSSVITALRSYRDLTARLQVERELCRARDELEQRVLERTAELRQANLRLRELDRLKDDFICSVSHELRTPLTSIRAFSEILQQDPKMGLPDRRRFLGIIVSESERLTRLINQILDLGKIESGRAEWNIAELDLVDVLENAASSISQLFRDKACQLELQLPERPLLVRADQDRLMQVSINLLSNAVKFIARGSGRVVVSTATSAGEISVTIADNGPGIPAGEQETIFEKFRQGGAGVLDDKPQGTGLGLPISRQIVEHLGGRLWVESVAGQGAKFSFALPRAG